MQVQNFQIGVFFKCASCFNALRLVNDKTQFSVVWLYDGYQLASRMMAAGSYGSRQEVKEKKGKGLAKQRTYLQHTSGLSKPMSAGVCRILSKQWNWWNLRTID